MSRPEIRLVACVLNFRPALRWRSPQELAGLLGKDYPRFQEPQAQTGPLVFFSSPGGEWAVWITPSAVGVETHDPGAFAEIRDRLSSVLESLHLVLKADLFTRIGLRSIFTLPPSWMASHQFPSPVGRPLGQVFQMTFQGALNSVPYLLREKWEPAEEGSAFVDLDVFSENIQPGALDERLARIYEASRQLTPSEEEETIASPLQALPARAFPPLEPPTSTTVAAYPDLVPFEPVEVEAVATERAHLIARKFRGHELSPEERERVAFLTKRLEELLPPVSPQELETLLKISEEAERIRERSQERRRRFGLG